MKVRKEPKPLTPPQEVKGKELYFEVSELCVHSESGEGAYADWSETYDCSLEKVSRNKELLNRLNFYAHRVPDEVYNANTVYVVVVTYNTGNSFGRAEGKLALAFVTENPDEAIAAKNAIENNTYASFYTSPKWLAGSGYTEWNGYFERVTSVDIEFHQVM